MIDIFSSFASRHKNRRSRFRSCFEYDSVLQILFFTHNMVTVSSWWKFRERIKSGNGWCCGKINMKIYSYFSGSVHQSWYKSRNIILHLHIGKMQCKRILWWITHQGIPFRPIWKIDTWLLSYSPLYFLGIFDRFIRLLVSI